MATEQLGVVRRIEATREAVLSMNRLNPYDQAKIMGKRVSLPPAKETWITVDCRTGVRSIAGSSSTPVDPFPTHHSKKPYGPFFPAALLPAIPALAIHNSRPSAYWRTRRERNLGPPLPRWSVRAILAAVCRVANISYGEIVSPWRPRRLAHPRHVAMYIMARSRHDLSYPMIGAILGRRDHTTVLSGVRRVPIRMIDEGSDTARWYLKAIALLSGGGLRDR